MKLNISDFLTVSQLNQLIYKKIHDVNEFKGILLKAEVSNVRISGGHIYLGLKDENTKINAIIWKNLAKKINFKLVDGQSIFAEGYLQYYQTSGSLSLIIQKIQLAGIGQMLLQLQKLKLEYEAKGFFDPQYKKPLPKYPQRIGVITAPNSAAFEDIQSTINRRYPAVQIFLFPAIVQGKNAPTTISNALKKINHYQEQIDVILLCRGGGSIEDLWCFNSPIVAEAIYKSEIPVVTGLGHAINLMIADLVADHHCETPTAAAEAVTPDQAVIKKLLNKNANVMINHIQQQINIYNNQIKPLQPNIISLMKIKIQNQELTIQNHYQQFNLKSSNMMNNLSGACQKQYTKLIKLMQDKIHILKTTLLLKTQRIQFYPQNYTHEYKLKLDQILKQMQFIWRNIHQDVTNVAKNLSHYHQSCHNFYRHQQEQLKTWNFDLNKNNQRMHKIIINQIDYYQSIIKLTISQLKTFNPKLILNRGYVLVYNEQKTSIIMNIKQITPQTKNINLKFNDGNIKAKLLSIKNKGTNHDKQ